MDGRATDHHILSDNRNEQSIIVMNTIESHNIIKQRVNDRLDNATALSKRFIKTHSKQRTSRGQRDRNGESNDGNIRQ